MDLAGRRQTARVCAQCLAPKHHKIFCRAIENLLSLEVAALTMAQLIDGLPTYEVATGIKGHLISRHHPMEAHEELCPGALEKTKEFRDAFDPNSLLFDSQTIQAYQDASPGSIAFNLRLFELLAVSIHQIAVFLFKMKPKLHTTSEIKAMVDWDPPPLYFEDEGGHVFLHRAPVRYRPTLFYHSAYLDDDQYPDGIADIAGYWAEDRIFGAVILFDRGEFGNESKDMYLHAGRLEQTLRIWRPLETQFHAMLDFVLAENVSDISQPPFPMFATDLNFHRYDPWDAMVRHHIFRDRWERRIPDVKPEERDVRSTHDFPELNAWFKKIQKAAESTPSVSDYEGSPREIALGIEGGSPLPTQSDPITSSQGYRSPEFCPSSPKDDFEPLSGYAYSPTPSSSCEDTRSDHSAVNNTAVDQSRISE